MGYKIKKQYILWVRFALLATSIVAAVFFGYPYAHNFLYQYKINYYHYHPHAVPVSVVDTHNLKPAIAVPILMYHGVLYEHDTENTSIDVFIQQMEMLKREGYHTISVDEFQKFKDGTFVLPAKPIIITFDDGRKDSYYTTDDIFRQLGFKATLFYASGPALDGDSFYLTWDELKTLQKSGRWEIEAHGRYSHKRIPTNSNAQHLDGRYLISKMYLMDLHRLETDAEFTKRVSEEYKNGVDDLKKNLGITARFFAVPLNDYGNLHPTNFAGAIDVNRDLMKKYFKMAFIEANDPDNVAEMHMPIYNFADEDPYLLRRIEMKNMPAEVLKKVLAREFPTAPNLSRSGKSFSDGAYESRLMAGDFSVGDNGLNLFASAPDQVAMYSFGQDHWVNYSVDAVTHIITGDSIAVLARVTDDNHYVACGVSNKQVYLRAYNNDTVTDLSTPVDLSTRVGEKNLIQVQVHDDTLSCSINGAVFFSNVKIPYTRGSAGIKIWGDKVAAKAVLESIDVKPIE